jgi:hypothetical protein
MRIVCSWCRGEGLHDFVGEKAPFEDLRETHGICFAHRVAVQARWKEAGRRSGLMTSQAISVGAWSEFSILEAGSHIAMSAAHLWISLKKLTRKSRS